MTPRAAGSVFPSIDVDRLGGGTLSLGDPTGGCDWQMVVVYRGLHCPLCKTYLAQLQEMEAQFAAIGVQVVIVSGDPEHKARSMADEQALTMPVGYGLSVAQMQALGLYISDPRGPQETDRPFPEPGLFVINGDGLIHMLDVSNAPFLRPDLGGTLSGITFIRKNNYPIRGTHRPS